AGAFPLIAANPVTSMANEDLEAMPLRFDGGALQAMAVFRARPGTSRHSTVRLADLGSVAGPPDGVPDLVATPWRGHDPLVLFPGTSSGGQLTFAAAPRVLMNAAGADPLRYLDAQRLPLTEGGPERLVSTTLTFPLDASRSSQLAVHVDTPAGLRTTSVGSRNGEAVTLRARLDDDAHTDIVLVSDAGTAAFLYGDGQGGFSAACRRVGFLPTGAWVVDADGDGRDDVAVYDATLESVFLLRNTGRVTEPCP
ncbi:MAG: hypothetical protein ACK4N5_23000, partial [Myxococcales bacterium]